VFCIATLLDCTRFNLESRPGIEVFDRRGFRSRDEDMGGALGPGCGACTPAPLACTTERMALGILSKARQEASLTQPEMFSI
jgi:hypothetical protein